jgi:hypothetical protein
MGAAEAVCFVEGSRGDVDVEDGDVDCSGHFVVLLALLGFKRRCDPSSYTVTPRTTDENFYIKSIG